MEKGADRWAECYRRYLGGDEAAFDELMDGLFYGLVHFLSGILKSVPAAEDAAMEAFTDLVVNRGRYNSKTSFKTYLYMLGRSKALDAMRRDRRLRVTALSGLEGYYDPDLDRRITLNEEKKRVRDAVAGLPGDMRTAVSLVYFEEMTYAEAAKVMKKNVKQIDNLIFRAKQLLRETITEEGK
ncbi:MAG: RNA polymerase sigma factor [Clostridia bacterium]|nr:RNA polymerase sigma factor [Clostridia bacterium]